MSMFKHKPIVRKTSIDTSVKLDREPLKMRYACRSTGWAKKTGPFLRVYNFATVGARNACDMSKFSKFYLEKNIELACQCV